MDESVQPAPLPDTRLVGVPQPAGAGDRAPVQPSIGHTGPPWVFLDIFRMFLFVACVLILLLCTLAVGMVAVGMFVGRTESFVDPHPSGAVVIILTTLFELPFVLYLARAAVRRYKQSFWESISWIRPKAKVAWFFLGGIGTNIASMLFLYFFHSTETSGLWKMLTDTGSAYIVSLLAISVIPFAEEAVFRGFLYPIAEGLAGRSFAITAVAFLFAAAHGPPGLPEWIVYSFLGLVLTYLRARTGSVAPSYLLHVGHNFASFVMVFIATDQFRAFGG